MAELPPPLPADATDGAVERNVEQRCDVWDCSTGAEVDENVETFSDPEVDADYQRFLAQIDDAAASPSPGLGTGGEKATTVANDLSSLLTSMPLSSRSSLVGTAELEVMHAVY